MLRLLALLPLLGALAGWPATAAAGPVEDAAAALARVEAQARSLEADRAALGVRLDAVAGEIEARKGQGRGVLGDRGLPGLLGESQALAERISALDREAATARERREAAALALLAAHDAEVAKARRELSGAAPERRAAALERLRLRQADRETARRELLARLGGPEHAPARIALAPTDDPDELREQADLFRDDRDRVRRALAEVDRRLEEQVRRDELERQLRDFVLDVELNDDDRQVRLRREETILENRGQGATEGPDVPGHVQVSTGSLAPLPGVAGPALPALTGDETAAELEGRRATLRRLADELDARARALDAKAREAGAR